MTWIAIDIGTTFIKGAVLDLEKFSLRHIQRTPFPEPLPDLPPLYREYNPQAVLAAVSTLMKTMLADTKQCEGIVFCSQMHGLVLTGAQGQPLSTLTTWQDQRGMSPHPSGKYTYYEALCQRISTEERRQMGNELRPGLPVGLLFWLGEQGKLPPPRSIPASLPDFIVANLCQARPVTEYTHAMSYGLLNLETMQWHSEVIQHLGLERLSWPEIVPPGTVVGYLPVGGRKIPCYTPIGDYQAAILGALLREGELSLNISTGSQASLLRPGLEFGDFQTRPFFDGRFLACITHIPAGWSLNLLVRLLTELAEAQQVKLVDPWPYIIQAATAVPATQLKVDLSFFTSSCGDRGQIDNIHEEELTVGHLFRGAFQNIADNSYASALRISPGKEWGKLVFSGGLAQKIPILRELICAKFQNDYRMCPTSEDTLLGLLDAALVFGKKIPTFSQATHLLEQKYISD